MNLPEETSIGTSALYTKLPYEIEQPCWDIVGHCETLCHWPGCRCDVDTLAVKVRKGKILNSLSCKEAKNEETTLGHE